MSACPLDQPCGSLLGALFFSAVVSTGFYGVTCMQTFFYYVQYGPAFDFVCQRTHLPSSYRDRDPLRMKSFVSQLQVMNITNITM
ncbi:hypothetical protein HD554DRAFT_2110178 [Boletus coccyginus]|nr:hypothetical protein HD554DRAFT_2110178 [Boletus coccyginus]